jgi:hypothetical protein
MIVAPTGHSPRTYSFLLDLDSVVSPQAPE